MIALGGVALYGTLWMPSWSALEWAGHRYNSWWALTAPETLSSLVFVVLAWEIAVLLDVRFRGQLSVTMALAGSTVAYGFFLFLVSANHGRAGLDRHPRTQHLAYGAWLSLLALVVMASGVVLQGVWLRRHSKTPATKSMQSVEDPSIRK